MASTRKWRICERSTCTFEMFTICSGVVRGKRKSASPGRGASVHPVTGWLVCRKDSGAKARYPPASGVRGEPYTRGDSKELVGHGLGMEARGNAGITPQTFVHR